MFDFKLDENKDYSTLRSSTPMGSPWTTETTLDLLYAKNAQMCGEECGENAPRRPARSLPMISTVTAQSASFRESIKTVSNKVRRMSLELGSQLPRNAKVLDSARVGDLTGHPGIIDPELGQCKFIKLQKSGSQAEHAIRGLKIINKATITADQTKSWELVETRFLRFANCDNLLHRSNFAECIGMKDSKEFANEIFAALVRRKGEKVIDYLTKEDLRDFWFQLSDKSFDARIQIFFDLCDKDLDGRITSKEVKEVILLSASANKLSKLKEQAADCATLVLEELDVGRSGYIELSQLQALMRKSLEGFPMDTIADESQMVTPMKEQNRIYNFAIKCLHFLIEKWKKLWIIALWALVLGGLFTWKFLQFREHDAFNVMGYCLCVAKGSAETLKLNMALILLPVSRNTITRLRSTRLGRLIPFDDNLKFHKIIGGGIVVAALVHILCHVSCDFPRIINATDDDFNQYLGVHFEKRPTYLDFLVMPVGYTGILMVILMTIAYSLANHHFRRNLVKLPWPFHRLTGFNAFWYSHHLFIIVYILLLAHSIKILLIGKPWYTLTTWMYIAVSMMLYAGERILRMFRALIKVDVVKVAIYPGNVLAIHMVKPHGFKYKSGMYLFLQCPEISSFEWHPFSITSAPDDPFLSVHIRTLGDWTGEMKRVFSRAIGDQTRMQIDNTYRLSGPVVKSASFPKLIIDGPYGAPAQDYLKYDVLLLVGLGIGATPFISILKDMLHHNKNFDASSPDRYPTESPKRSKSKKLLVLKKPKAYFYWVTREQHSFDWFRGVMRDIEAYDKREFIEMHNYLTSVYEEGDTRSTLIMMLQALHYKRNGVDLVSGTRARTHFGRPNWKSVLSNLAAEHQGKRVGVFYCGPAVVSKQLETLCGAYSQSGTTKFSFHKENF